MAKKQFFKLFGAGRQKGVYLSSSTKDGNRNLLFCMISVLLYHVELMYIVVALTLLIPFKQGLYK